MLYTQSNPFVTNKNPNFFVISLYSLLKSINSIAIITITCIVIKSYRIGYKQL